MSTPSRPAAVRAAVIARDPLSLGGVLRPLDASPCVEVVRLEDPHRPQLVVVVVDGVDDASLKRVRAVRETSRVLVVAGRLVAADVGALAEAGAGGVLRRSEATPPRLVDAVVAVAAGRGTVPADLVLAAAVPLLDDTSARRSHLSVAPGSPHGRPPLSDRETHVLTLLADGLSTLEIATQLAYSERTIKSIVHDVTARLRLRNRTHAVAYAVRNSLI